MPRTGECEGAGERRDSCVTVLIASKVGRASSHLSRIVKVIFAASPGERSALARDESKIEFGASVTSSRLRPLNQALS
jgi:hypothetical protein